jgi:DtxR family Mn-dependent transcriptional regulator
VNTELTQTEENYLKAIYHLSSDKDLAVTTNCLADNMKTKPATVSDMVKRLSKKKVIKYEKYKGVNLTETGIREALKIVRKHRLWEVFLVDKLAFRWDEVHEIAEQLEHIHSSLLVKRLDGFLGNPTIDPHGDPIPDKNGNFKVGPTLLLSELSLGEKGAIIAVKNDDPRLLQHLDKLNIRLGLKVEILEQNEFDGSIQLKLDNRKIIFMSSQISTQLMISKIV